MPAYLPLGLRQAFSTRVAWLDVPACLKGNQHPQTLPDKLCADVMLMTLVRKVLLDKTLDYIGRN